MTRAHASALAWFGPLALLSLAVGCGEGGDSKGGSAAQSANAAGTGAPGGSSTGGSGTGGSSTGGSSTGGSSTGGSSTGGAAGSNGVNGGATSTGGTAGAAASTGAGAAGGAGGASGGGGGTGGGGGAGRASGGSAGRGNQAGMGGTSAGQGGAPQAGGGSGSDVIVTITNGGYWQDTEGNRIEAHGGGLLFHEGTWYWVGEDKSHNSGNFKAVNVYASQDLSHWEFRHAIITKSSSTELAAADRIIERPKLIYNDSTKKFVMWLHWEGENYATAEAGVFTCDTVDGDYTQVRHFRPNNRMSRDDTLFKDDDGKAYFLSASNENADLSLYLLTDDYTNMDHQMTTLWAGSYREAPAIMKANDSYFLVNSGATGWDPNQQKYATASSLDGSFGSLSNLGDSTGFDTQSTYVIPVKGTKTTTYVYMGDRWQDPDLGSSKYIWLPLRVSSTNKLTLDFYETWTLNVTTGEWSGGGDDGYIPSTGWQLVGVDSEETSGEDGHAENAFDDSRSTYWHTEWEAAEPTHPHEIVIDLGASYSLTSMRYTPRQDKDENGMIDDYEFYASASATDWGTALKTGSFGDTRTPTVVTFPAKAARYIRLVALSEINAKAYASIAEIDVAGPAL